jgi:hypothetical protein
MVVLEQLEQSRQDKTLLYPPKKQAKEGQISYVILEFPFASVLTFSWCNPPLVSLEITKELTALTVNVVFAESLHSPPASSSTVESQSHQY